PYLGPNRRNSRLLAFYNEQFANEVQDRYLLHLFRRGLLTAACERFPRVRQLNDSTYRVGVGPTTVGHTEFFERNPHKYSFWIDAQVGVDGLRETIHAPWNEEPLQVRSTEKDDYEYSAAFKIEDLVGTEYSVQITDCGDNLSINIHNDNYKAIIH